MIFHLEGLNKDSAVALARHFGLRRDWARVKLPEIRTMLRAYGPERLIDAAKSLPDYFDEEDVADLTDPEVEFDADDEAPTNLDSEAAPHASSTPAPSATETSTMQQPAQPANVQQAAQLLAQLLAGAQQPQGIDADAVREIVKAELASIPAREILVRSEHVTVTIDGLQHHKFESLLKTCAARAADGHRLNVWLYGPPGTGKTTAARNVAKALGMNFHCNGALSTKYELTGFIDAAGVCHSPEFRKAWEKGGVYLFDEIDGSVSQAVVAFNAALANGVMSFPDGMIERHPDCVVIAAANTINGATSEFTGRTKLDAATLDRFVFIEWDIDARLEKAMAGGHLEWMEDVMHTRRKVKERGIKVIISPRATQYGASLLAAGLPRNDVREMVLRKGMTNEQWNEVRPV